MGIHFINNDFMYKVYNFLIIFKIIKKYKNLLNIILINHSVAYSIKNKLEVKAIATKNRINFYNLYLVMENSSVITSIVAIQRKVPKVKNK